MDNLTKNLAQHLNSLRKRQNLTILQLVDGIGSHRQYLRYLSGESVLPYDKLKLFCERLSMTLDAFFFSLRSLEDKEYPIISKLHELTANSEFESVVKFCKKHELTELNNPQNKKFYEYAYFRAQYKTDRLNLYSVLEKFQDLIDYPNCLNKTIFDYVDISVLSSITEIEIKQGRSDALEKLNEILLNKDLLFSSNELKHILPAVYANVALFLGRLKRYEESLIIADKGLAFSKLHNDMSSLGHLLYLKAYNSLVTDKEHDALISAARCLAFCMATDNKHQIEIFYKTLKKDFGFDIFEVFFKYKAELLYL